MLVPVSIGFTSTNLILWDIITYEDDFLKFEIYIALSSQMHIKTMFKNKKISIGAYRLGEKKFTIYDAPPYDE